MKLKAPFPWFGGKSRCAHIVWDRFGDVKNYVEPFAGSLAVLLGRPHPPHVETVNDLDAYVANFWRSVHETGDPDAVAYWADWPVNECDLHARHLWLTQQTEFRERMRTDPHYYDAKIAGWWLWGLCMWIGSGWCQNPEWTGRVNGGGEARGINANAGRRARGIQCAEKKPGLQRAGRGIHAQRPQLTYDQGIQAISGKRPELARAGGKGIHQLTHRMIDCTGNGGATGRGILASGSNVSVRTWLYDLRDRLRNTRICCGDWARILTPSVTTVIGTTAVFLDPPYSAASGRKANIYSEDSFTVADDVRTWCIEHGSNKRLRIALCGYDGEHNELELLGWQKVAWQTSGGYANNNPTGNRGKKLERIWFSPHCLQDQQLFSEN